MLELIQKRRSIRRYTADPVSEADVRALLEAAMAAPSANNLQPWSFVVVRDAATRQQLAPTHTWSRMCADAPLVLAVCGDEQASRHWVEDTSAATENLLLAVTALGLGAVWIGVHPDPERETHVKATLGIPDELRILCLIAVGHPAETRPPRTQYDERKVHYERF